MQFKTREFLLWIHLHSFDAIRWEISKYNHCYQRSRSEEHSRFTDWEEGDVCVFKSK